MYSASVELNATVSWRLDCHEIGPLARKNTQPLVECLSFSEDTGLPPELEEDVNRLFIRQTMKELEELIRLRDEIDDHLKDNYTYNKWVEYLMEKNDWPMHIAVYWGQRAVEEMTDTLLGQMYERLNRLSFYEVID